MSITSNETSDSDVARKDEARPTLSTEEYEAFLAEKIRPLIEQILEEERRREGRTQAVAGADRPASAEDPAPGKEAEAPATAGIDVYRMADVHERRQAARRRDDLDAHGRVMATLNAMLKRGSWRALRTLGSDWRRQLDELEGSFPNCGRLVDLLRAQAALAVRGDGALPGLAVLLDGPPGIGKTVIVESIAAIVGGGLRRLAMGAAQSGAQLAGSDEFWSNSRPGVVFEALVHGEFANPVVQLDELDKVSPDLPYGPLGALYELLEPVSARQFRDAALPTITLDASRILWFATSNQRRFIPTPILDRMTVVEMREPRRSEMARIIESVDRVLHAARPSLSGMQLSGGAARALGTLPPRRIWKAIQEAYGRAAFQGRDVVLPEDLPPLDDAVPTIGFR